MTRAAALVLAACTGCGSLEQPRTEPAGTPSQADPHPIAPKELDRREDAEPARGEPSTKMPNRPDDASPPEASCPFGYRQVTEADGNVMCEPPAEPAAVARERFQEAIGMYEAGDYEGALVAFRDVLQLHPSAAIRFNLATTLDRLGRRDDARRELRRILDDPSAEQRVRKTAEDMLKTLDD